jgi:ribose transport system substrate-binding protein
MKKLLAMFTALSLLVFAVGCNNESSESAGESAEEGTESVAVVLKTLSSQYWKFVEAGAKDAGKDLGVNVTVIGPSSESQIMEQVNMVEDSLNQDPDALIVAPTQPSTVIPALGQAEQQGIPVLFVDTDADWEAKTTFIGTENFSAGQAAGELLASKLNKGDKVALIAGALGNPAMDARIEGAKEALEKAGMVIAAEQPADSDKTKAMSVMENILQNHPDIKGVYSANDDMALGAFRAASGKSLDIPIIGTDGTIEAVEAVIAGKLTGTVAQSPYDMGYQGVENAIKAINGEEIEKRIDSGIDIITAENAQEKLDFLKGIVGE